MAKYMALEACDKSVQAEYVWIGGSGQDIRSKTRTLTAGYPKQLSDLPDWNYDGSSTGQADGGDSEMWLRPVKFVKDPFRPIGDNVIVLCECLNAATLEAASVETNRRWRARSVFEQAEVAAEHPWYGLEQEYTMFDARSKCHQPLGWPDAHGAFPEPQGKYYCGVGAACSFGRSVVEAHYRCCLYAGLTISGINAEVMPGQWEFQIGPVEGIDAGDQLWLARYMLQRVAEDFGATVSFAPKPVAGDWNGAGCHCNFSTASMRREGGYSKIIEAVERLGKRHKQHMAVYGADNHLRMTGVHETASYDEFSYGVANRGASIRIPRQAEKDKRGYLEDRRPAANCDPYDVTAIVVESALGLTGSKHRGEVYVDSDCKTT